MKFIAKIHFDEDGYHWLDDHTKIHKDAFLDSLPKKGKDIPIKVEEEIDLADLGLQLVPGIIDPKYDKEGNIISGRIVDFGVYAVE